VTGRLTKKEKAALLNRPLPPIDTTLTTLAKLAYKTYETKARSKEAIRLSHSALADILQMLESYAKHESLVSKGVVESVHRSIYHRLKLEIPCST
jgi:hypothetical protein